MLNLVVGLLSDIGNLIAFILLEGAQLFLERPFVLNLLLLIFFSNLVQSGSHQFVNGCVSGTDRLRLLNHHLVESVGLVAVA